jgi:hypothetical protein
MGLGVAMNVARGVAVDLVWVLGVHGHGRGRRCAHGCGRGHGVGVAVGVAVGLAVACCNIELHQMTTH